MEPLNESDKPAGDNNEKQETDVSTIPWHSAFIQAIQLELKDYKDVLEFHSEYQLISEPLRIDCVVIKKNPDTVIKKNIAAIFREANLLEYKSPDDYISVNDFYKVYGYACLYASFEKVPVTNLTISFIESRHPRELLGHLQEVRGYKVEERWSGIYIITGDIIPIQIIDSRQLSFDENLWLRDLCNKLNPCEMRMILDKVSGLGKTSGIGTYLNAIIKSNQGSLQEVLKMSNTQLTLDEILKEAGFVAKWEAKGFAEGEARGEARGEEKKAAEIAKNMLHNGFSVEQTAELSGLDVDKVRVLSN